MFLLKGMDLWSLPPTTAGLLTEFFRRYHPGIPDQNMKILYSNRFVSHPNGNKTVRAVLCVHIMNNREFRGIWSQSERLAQISAIENFRSDPEVQRIAEWLHRESG